MASETSPGRFMVLLGAGASCDAGLPASRQLTERIREHFRTGFRGARGPWCTPEMPVLGEVVDYVHDVLAKAGTGPVDIERLYSVLGALAKRSELDVSLFVDRWDSRIGLGDHPKYGEGVRFSEAHHETVLALRRVLAIDDATQLSYLDPLMKAASQPAGVTIATLNFDLTIEEAGKRAGVTVATGIEAISRSQAVEWPANGIRLLKVHGSIDWLTAMPEEGKLGKNYVTDVLSDPGQMNAGAAVLFGQGDKLSSRGPFLSLLADFERALKAVESLVVVGYSFRDDHVNELIRRWLDGDSLRRIVVLDCAFPERPSDDVEPFVRDLVLTLLDPAWHRYPSQVLPDGFVPRLHVVRKTAANGLAEALAIAQE